MIDIIEVFIGFLFFITSIALSTVLFMFLCPNIVEKFLQDEELNDFRHEIDRMNFVSKKARSIFYAILSFFIFISFLISYALIFE